MKKSINKISSKLLVVLILGSFVFVGASCTNLSTKYKDGGIFVSIDQAESWQQMAFIRTEKKKELNISSANIRTIEFDPINSEKIWLGTEADGIYYTENGGNNWVETHFKEGKFLDIAINPKNTDTLYTVNSNNIYKSIDKGEAWDIVYTETTGASITQIDVDWYSPKNIIATTSTGTILKSYDYGTNWSVLHRTKKGLEITELVVNPHDSREMFIVSKDSGFEKTIDGGATWTEMEDTLKEFSDAKKIKKLMVSPSSRNTLYIASYYGLLKSVDKGNSWTVVSTLVPAKSAVVRNIVIDPENSKTMYFTVENLIHKTTDGGVSWKTIENFPSGRLIYKLILSPDEHEVIYAGTYEQESPNKTPFGF